MTSPSDQRQWFIVHRWQEYDAEIRAAYVRIIAVTFFYAVQLYDFAVRKATTVEFHRTITALAVAWIALSLLALISVRRQYLPPWLKYATTITDVVLLTVTLLVATGPQSPMVVGYFIILILAAMRFSLPLIWVATVACLASYVFVLAACHPNWFGTASRNFVVPRREELIVGIAIASAGIALGQIARRVRRLADDYARRVEARAQ